MELEGKSNVGDELKESEHTEHGRGTAREKGCKGTWGGEQLVRKGKYGTWGGEQIERMGK